MIKAVLFDVDGTLLDTTEFIMGAFEHTLKTHGVPAVARHEIAKLVGGPILKIYKTLVPDKPPEELFETHASHQMEHLHTIKVYPQVLETLKKLKKHTLKIGAITNRTGRNARKSLEITGLMPFIDYLLTKDDVQNHKPHPEPILKALAHFKIKPSEAIMIGDATPDIEAGKNANVKTIGVTYGFGKDIIKDAKPDYLVDSFEEILPIIKDQR